MKKDSFFQCFFRSNKPIFASEFGYSVHTQSRTVGPWSREIYILHFVSRGSVDFSGFHVDEGQAFLISKERMHLFTISDDYEHYWIGFDGDAVGTLFEKFGLKYSDHQLLYVENSDFAKTLFSSALKKLKSKDAEDAESLALSVLFSMLPLLKCEIESKTLHKINYAEKAHMLIKSNYMYPLKMSDVAREIHLSEKYMYRLFLERFHLSPQQFLIRTRMEAALELLRKSGRSVTEVALSVGYSSLPAFSKAFSAYFGGSPSSFAVISSKKQEKL